MRTRWLASLVASVCVGGCATTGAATTAAPGGGIEGATTAAAPVVPVATYAWLPEPEARVEPHPHFEARGGFVAQVGSEEVSGASMVWPIAGGTAAITYEGTVVVLDAEGRTRFSGNLFPWDGRDGPVHIEVVAFSPDRTRSLLLHDNSVTCSMSLLNLDDDSSTRVEITRNPNTSSETTLFSADADLRRIALVERADPDILDADEYAAAIESMPATGTVFDAAGMVLCHFDPTGATALASSPRGHHLYVVREGRPTMVLDATTCGVVGETTVAPPTEHPSIDVEPPSVLESEAAVASPEPPSYTGPVGIVDAAFDGSNARVYVSFGQNSVALDANGATSCGYGGRFFRTPGGRLLMGPASPLESVGHIVDVATCAPLPLDVWDVSPDGRWALGTAAYDESGEPMAGVPEGVFLYDLDGRERSVVLDGLESDGFGDYEQETAVVEARIAPTGRHVVIRDAAQSVRIYALRAPGHARGRAVWDPETHGGAAALIDYAARDEIVLLNCDADEGFRIRLGGSSSLVSLPAAEVSPRRENRIDAWSTAAAQRSRDLAARPDTVPIRCVDAQMVLDGRPASAPPLGPCSPTWGGARLRADGLALVSWDEGALSVTLLEDGTRVHVGWIGSVSSEDLTTYASDDAGHTFLVSGERASVLIRSAGPMTSALLSPLTDTESVRDALRRALAGSGTH